jgi:hypothetical protein
VQIHNGVVIVSTGVLNGTFKFSGQIRIDSK